MNEKVFPGNSITYGWPLALSNIVNAGVTGQDSPAILARVPALVSAYPSAKIAHFMAGTNNLNNEAGWNQAADDLEAMGDLAIAAGWPFLIALPPPRSWLINGLINAISAMCASRGWTPVDYFSAMNDANGDQISSLFLDGTHPNAAGYAVMNRVLYLRLISMGMWEAAMAQSSVGAISEIGVTRSNSSCWVIPASGTVSGTYTGDNPACAGQFGLDLTSPADQSILALLLAGQGQAKDLHIIGNGSFIADREKIGQAWFSL